MTHFSINALNLKRSQLIRRRQELEKEYKASLRELDQEIEDINKAFDVLAKAAEPFICKSCGGTGSVRHCDAAGDMDDYECETCHGTGIDVSAVGKKNKRA